MKDKSVSGLKTNKSVSGLEKSVLHLFDHLAYGGVKWVDFEFRIANFEFERAAV